jgi:hypothetical protein
MNIFMYYIMTQRINMMLTTSTIPRPSNISRSITLNTQLQSSINTNISRTNVSRFNMGSIFVAKGRTGGSGG